MVTLWGPKEGLAALYVFSDQGVMAGSPLPKDEKYAMSSGSLALAGGRAFHMPARACFGGLLEVFAAAGCSRVWRNITGPNASVTSKPRIKYANRFRTLKLLSDPARDLEKSE